MAERDRLETIVERIVAEVLEPHTVQLREEFSRRLAEETATIVPPEVGQGTNSAELARAVGEIYTGSTQREILKALLDSCSHYAARVALFVVKSGSATGWQGRGLANEDALKDFALDLNAEAIKHAIDDRVAIAATTEGLDSHFLAEFGTPVNGEARLFPLLLKDKVAALVYADGGTEGTPHLDVGSLELLVLCTGTWLEVNSLRKQAQKAIPPADSEPEPPSPASTASAPSFNDPFAGHVPAHAMAAAAASESFTPSVPIASTAAAVPEPDIAEAESSLEAATVPAPSVADTAVSAEDQETLRKAQRFARLLIDEIKLYNQAKVAEGRKNRDLYDRLKDAIEKSRITYQKRYGNTVAGSSDYFQHELVRSLAEDDISIMGANFPH